jgi:hypothetical protein
METLDCFPFSRVKVDAIIESLDGISASLFTMDSKGSRARYSKTEYLQNHNSSTHASKRDTLPQITALPHGIPTILQLEDGPDRTKPARRYTFHSSSGGENITTTIESSSASILCSVRKGAKKPPPALRITD